MDVSQATGANRIQGNFIGTNSLGTLSRANGGYGITLDGSSATRVGGANAGLGNVIASNAAILLQGPGLLPGAGIRVSSSDNIIRNNNIGTGRDPGTDLRNTGWGILITPAANRNVVTDNTIKFNTLGGVSADETTNTIRNNKIAANIGIGIDIGLVGLTTDGMPVLTTVIVNGATLTMTVSGSLTSTPNTTFAIDLYGNTAPDPSGYGEGEFFLGTVEVTTDSSGTVYFTAIVDGGYDGFFVTATATDLVEGGTSEFAKNVVAYLPATVQVHVFEDINSNGVQDFEEAYWGMSVVVTLQSTTGGATYIGYVNLAGGVTFEGVVADTYTLTFSLPAGYEFTLQDQGSDDFLDSDVNSAGTTDPFTVLASEFNSSFAAGLLFTPTTPS